MLLFAAIISYITSNIIALAFIFTGKRLNPGWFRMLASLHLLFGVLFAITLFTNKEESPYYISFLVFFCSGIITGGLALGRKTPVLFKIYFGIYCASIFLFIISPSTLLNFLITASFSSGEKMISVKSGFFIERQRSTFDSDQTDVLYKLIQKNGMFHKTIARDLDFRGKLDSIKVISFSENHGAEIRGYTSRKNFVEDNLDSTDVAIDFIQKRRNEIERKL